MAILETMLAIVITGSAGVVVH
jgi:hypothetical protein